MGRIGFHLYMAKMVRVKVPYQMLYEKQKGEDIDGIVSACLFDDKGNVYKDNQSVFVFNEDYVNSRVKIREDGLKSIVLLGELGNLEDKILDLQLRIEAESKRNDEFRKNADEYKDSNNTKSPSNCRLQINLGLSGDTNWAGRERIINDGKRNSSVTDKVIDSIAKLHPTDTLDVLKRRYEETLNLLKQVRSNDAEQINDAPKISVMYDEENIRTLLEQKVEQPVLSEREQYMLKLIDDGRMEQINDMKGVFSKEKTKKCPFCLQDITEAGKHSLLESIEKVLSKEVDIHEQKLKECILQEVIIDFSGMDVINSQNLTKCKEIVEDINKEIHKVREVTVKKINHPYTPITGFECNLSEKLDRYEKIRINLQQEIDAYNAAVKRIHSLKSDLSADNAAIAHYEVSSSIRLWQQAIENQKSADEELEKSTEKLKDLNDELDVLKARKKNIKIAVELINKSLRYVFYSKDRLEIKVENEKYILYAHGQAVRPNSISVGERNIIALCYYFTEMIMNHDAKDGYAGRYFLVIDDPVSSFDLENKIGMMSLIKAKLSDIIMANKESQILIMTHDIQCLYDLTKICKEVGYEVKVNGGSKTELFLCRELNNKELVPFSYRKRNEYSELLKNIYDYACGEAEGEELVIGNSMRRVLEAFSTFVYKKGIAEISNDPEILHVIEDKDYVDYFKNLMYRLVLNGDSHMEERTASIVDMEYLEYLSDEERRRTAREVICFIYLLNDRHILAHLVDKKDAITNIKQWCSEIKSFYSSETVKH